MSKKTKLKIMFKDIKDIKKTTNVMIDNSIKISLSNGMNIKLTSFLNRDECFQIMWTVWAKVNNKSKTGRSTAELVEEEEEKSDDNSSFRQAKPEPLTKMKCGSMRNAQVNEIEFDYAPNEDHKTEA